MKVNKLLSSRFTKLKALFSATLMASLSGYMSAPATAAFDDAGTDFSEDETETHVWNEALEPIDLVNSILCFTKQMRANDFVNEGPYSVLADEGLCFDNDENDENSQSSAAGNNPEYMQVIVNAVQALPGDPLTVSVWMPEMSNGDDGAFAIKFKAVVREGATDTNPFGDFTFNYDFYDDIEDLASTGGGEIHTVNDVAGMIGFTLYDSALHGGTPSSQTASVLMSSDRTSGVALTSGQWGAFSNAFALSFDEENVLVQNASSYAGLPYKVGDNSGTCLDRTSYEDAVWRYDLYDSTSGERVEVNAGFPIRYDSDGDTTLDSFGHVGYWGLWEGQPGTLEDGDTVFEEDADGEDVTSYTVVKAPGRLIRYAVEVLSLSDLDGIPFNYWNDDAFTEGFDAWVVHYLTAASDGVAGDGFYITDGLNWSHDGPPNLTSQTPELISLSANEVLNLHSDHLGGEARYLAGDTIVSFFSETFVNGSETGVGEALASGSLDLRCFERCPKGDIGLSQLQDFDGVNGPYDSTGSVSTPISFSFSKDGSNALALVKTSNSEVVRYNAAITEGDLANSPHNWGMRSGPMVTADVAATLSNTWDIYDPATVTEYYVWETGINPWNQLITVKDSEDNIPSFDRPLQFAYTHSDANDRSGSAGDSDGVTLMLNYGGNGDFWGIPSDIVSGTDRHIPAFNLADGTTLGASNQYVVKAREIEQTMASDAGACTAMTITDPAVPVPTGLQGSADIGDMPEVDSAPKAIAGELIDDPE